MSFVKYRLKEVAADFGISPKEVSDIISKFYDRPKSNTQVLNDNELNVVFDYMTQKNQIKDMAQVFAVKPAAPKAEAPKSAAPQQPAQNRPQYATPAPAPAPKTQDQLFEEKLKAFMSESDSKLSSMRADHRTKSRRR